MNQSTKVREPAKQRVGVAATVPLMTEDEYTRVKTVLGYSGLERVRGRTVLASVLRALDIAVLDPRSVRRYQRERRQEATRKVKDNTRLFSSERITWRWVSVLLRNYRKVIPLTAIQTAMRVAERLPDAQFYVEELRRDQRVVDPFLYVAYKGARYYLAHWDEPKFQE